MVTTLVTLSVRPDPPVPDAPLADKATHVLAYAGTTFALLLAAVWRPGRGEGPFPKAAAIVALGLLVLGAGLEGVQELDVFAQRTAEVGDAIANAVGVLLGTGTWGVLRNRSREGATV